MVAKSALALAAFFAGAQTAAAARDFLAQSVAREVVEGMLMSEIPALGSHGGRISALEEALAPVFAALPKNRHGRLEPPTVRYALHRHFVQQRGWYVKGLDPAGDGWNSSSPEGVMKDRVPAYVQSLFERRLQGRGMNITELAIFTATLADLIERDAALGLENIYRVMDLSTSGAVTEDQLDAAIRAFIASFILGSGYPVATMADIKASEQELQEIYPDYELATMWAVDARQDFNFKVESRRNPFVNQEISFDQAAATLQDIMHNIAALAKYECPSLKAKLLQLEVGDTGRVRLSDFYSSDVVPIKDSPDFLTHLGVLDNTDPSMPMLIISNYMVSQSNCMAESSYYHSCCLDECEGLLSHLERAVAAPSATPARIAEVIAVLPSDTVDAPRNLSSSLLARLEEVADYHNGLVPGHVPLHGRLFMQWMHHAYPRECPWPMVSGTTKPLSQDEWLDRTGRDDIQATQEEMYKWTSMAKYRASMGMEDTVPESPPWVLVEELVASHQALLAPEVSPLSAGVRGIMALVALVSFSASLVRASGLLAGSGKDKLHSV